MAGTSFTFNNPRVERVISGQGSLVKLAEEVERLVGKRALVLISPSVSKTFLLDRVKAALGGKCAAVFDQVKPHSPTESIGKAVELARNANVDILISIGGGSAI